MKLERGKVALRFLERNDAFTSVAWRNNPKIWEHTLNSPNRIITIEDELEWIDKVMAEDNSYRFAILYDEVYIGNIQLTNIENNESYYGIFIGNTAYLGKGIGKAATKLILDFGFNVLKLNKIKLRVKVQNFIAYNIYMNLGFKEIKRDSDLIYMELSNNQFFSNEVHT